MDSPEIEDALPIEGILGNDINKTPEEFSDESLFGEDKIDDILDNKKIFLH